MDSHDKYFDDLMAQAELDYQEQCLKDMDELHLEAEKEMQREALLNELSDNLIGCPYYIIDDIVDDEVSKHVKAQVQLAYDNYINS